MIFFFTSVLHCAIESEINLDGQETKTMYNTQSISSKKNLTTASFTRQGAEGPEHYTQNKFYLKTLCQAHPKCEGPKVLSTTCKISLI